MKKCYSKKLDFLYYQKEKELYENVKKRVKNGFLNISEEYLANKKVFIEMVRTLRGYDGWLNNKNTYRFCQNGEELYFTKNKSLIKSEPKRRGKPRPCAKINKFTKKVEYFDTVTDLVEDMGYDVTWVYKHLSKDRTLDGFYLCYENEVDEILERLS